MSQITVPGAGVGQPGASNQFGGAPVTGGNNTSLVTLASLPLGGPIGNQVMTQDAGLATWSPGWSSNGVMGLRKKFVVPGAKNVQQLMASPPTVAQSSTNPASAGQAYLATNQGGSNYAAINMSNWTTTRSYNPTVFSGFPSYLFLQYQQIQTALGSNCVQYSVMFSGTVLVLDVYGSLSSSAYVKVNDQYVSLTSVAMSNASTHSYLVITFASAVISQRIDILFSNIFGVHRIAGMYTGALTDTLLPAEIRGPRIIVIGDSITTATGAGGQAQGYVQVFSEYLGFDDVSACGIGGTGLVVPGGYVNYLSRIGTDVIPYAPDEIIVAGFFNDNGQQLQAMYNNAVALINTIQAALPYCRITFFGPYAPYGLGTQYGNNLSATATGFVATRAAIQNAVALYNSPYVRMIDPSTIPLYNTTTLPYTPQTLTLTSSVAASGTSLHVNFPGLTGQNYQFSDGSRCRCLTSSGTTMTIDSCPNAQAIGAVITQTGASWITGNGYAGAPTGVGNADLSIIADHTHPTNYGHFNLGCTLAEQWAMIQNG